MNKKISTIWGMIILISISLIVGALILIGNKQNQSDCCSGSDVKSSDTQFEWKTYKNDQYGFKIDYPGSWNYEGMSPGNIYFTKDGSDVWFRISTPIPEVGYEDMDFISDEKVAIKDTDKYFNKTTYLSKDKTENLLLFNWLPDNYSKSIQIAFRYEDIEVINKIISTFSFTDSDLDKDLVICAQDAKECPNGSFVSRTGPNCEFAECAK